MKKTLSILLSIVMLLSIATGLNFSAYANTSGDYEYEVLDDGTAQITKYNGNSSNVTIPSKLNGYTVTKLGDDAFNSCLLTSITIADSVTNIGSATFAGCKKLTKITIPKKVKRIEFVAFYNCDKLKDITILSKNVVIDDYAFGYIEGNDYDGAWLPLPIKDCKIYGYKNSTAEKYAKNNGLKSITLIDTSAIFVTLSSTSYTYNGKVKKPSVTVKDSKGKKIDKKYYTVSYSSGRKNVGQYAVTVKFKGNYSGTVKKTFTIKPKAATISKVTAGKKAFIVKWKKQATQTTGYQIQYSTSSKFKGAKTVTVSKNKTTSKKISKLKAKKKYYVRIRTYKTVKINGKNTKIYSGWSKVKTVKTK